MEIRNSPHNLKLKKIVVKLVKKKRKTFAVVKEVPNLPMEIIDMILQLGYKDEEHKFYQKQHKKKFMYVDYCLNSMRKEVETADGIFVIDPRTKQLYDRENGNLVGVASSYNKKLNECGDVFITPVF
tara:strand:- start:87 stop:467 length:381 start_codon:yes stop_codon:yes gene_type:complete